MALQISFYLTPDYMKGFAARVSRSPKAARGQCSLTIFGTCGAEHRKETI